MIWTSSNIDRLIRLSHTELSSTKIAIELGTTKNSVLGKLYRIKLSNGHTPKPLKVRNHNRLNIGYFKTHGKKACTLCKKMYMTYSRYDKFCYDCKRRSPYTDC